MKRVICCAVAALIASLALGEDRLAGYAGQDAPALVVGIVVDQMRYDYIYRYWDQYGPDGFKRLVREGAFYRNAEYDYVPTYTGPGHASVFTGTTPAVHGIVGNDWYDRLLKRDVYCVADTNCSPIGVAKAKEGARSPVNLLTTTVTDELKLAGNFRPKVIGVSLKDRAAILPAGHLADGAFWLDDASGRWITSSYYTNAQRPGLPAWVEKFNASCRPDAYLTYVMPRWTPVKSPAHYDASQPGTGTNGGFDHALMTPFLAAKARSYGLLRATPIGNALTEEFAEAAVTGEGLGRGKQTDFLTINFASTDYVGHKYGPRAMETEDTYLRLDETLAKLLRFLEKAAGRGRVMVFLTADHGVVDAPGFSIAHRLPGNRFHTEKVMQSLTNHLKAVRGTVPGMHFANQQIYLDPMSAAEQQGVEDEIRGWLVRQPGVADVVSNRDLRRDAQAGTMNEPLARGIYPPRSGDLTVLLEPGWLEQGEAAGPTATSHGTPYQYDTHVPVLFWGCRIPHRLIDEPVTITQIAPTLSQLLNIQFPSGSGNKILPGLRIERQR